MTPAERLDLLLGRGPGDASPGGLPLDALREATGPSAELAELEAIAKALERLDLAVPLKRGAALRELLEAEAGRLPPSRPPGGGPPLPPGWLPWLGGLGIVLLLALGLWLLRPVHPVEIPAPGGATRPSPTWQRVSASTASLVQGTAASGSTAAPQVQPDAASSLPGDRGSTAVPSRPAGPEATRSAAPASNAGSSAGTGTPLPEAIIAQPVGAGGSATVQPSSVRFPSHRDGYLRGRVTDGAGRPIADAEVTAYRVDRVGIFVQRTGGDGRFAIQLPWGRYRLEARASGFASRWYSQVAAREAAAILIWESDAPVPTVQFALPSALSPVTPGG